MRARVTHKSVSRREGGHLATYNAGDEMDVSQRLLAAFGDRLAVVGSAPVADPVEQDPVRDEDVQAVLDATADDARDMLPMLSNSQLQVAADIETRKGVGSAIEMELSRR